MKSGRLTFDERVVEVICRGACAAEITLTDERVARIEVAADGRILKAWDRDGEEITPGTADFPLRGRAHVAGNSRPRGERQEPPEPLSGVAWVRDLGSRLWHSVVGEAPSESQEDTLLAYLLRPTRSIVSEDALKQVAPLQLMRAQLEFLRSESQGLFATCGWDPMAVGVEAERLAETIGWMERVEGVRTLEPSERQAATMGLWQEMSAAVVAADKPLLFSIDWQKEGKWTQMLLEVTPTATDGHCVRFFNCSPDLAELFPSTGLPLIPETGNDNIDAVIPLVNRHQGAFRRYRRAVEFRNVSQGTLSELLLPMVLLQTADLGDDSVEIDIFALLKLVQQSDWKQLFLTVAQKYMGAVRHGAAGAGIEAFKAHRLDLDGLSSVALGKIVGMAVGSTLPENVREMANDAIGRALKLQSGGDDSPDLIPPPGYHAGRAVFEMVFSHLTTSPGVECEWLGEPRGMKSDAPISKVLGVYFDIVRGECRALRRLKFQLHQLHLTFDRTRSLLSDHSQYRALLIDLCDRVEVYALEHQQELFGDAAGENLDALTRELGAIRAEVRGVEVAQESSTSERLRRGLTTFRGGLNVPPIAQPLGATEGAVLASSPLPRLQGECWIDDWMPVARELFEGDRHEELREICLEIVERMPPAMTRDERHVLAAGELSQLLSASIYHRMAPFLATSASEWSSTPDEVTAMVRLWTILDALAGHSVDPSELRALLEADLFFDELSPRSTLLADLRTLEGRRPNNVKWPKEEWRQNPATRQLCEHRLHTSIILSPSLLITPLELSKKRGYWGNMKTLAEMFQFGGAMLLGFSDVAGRGLGVAQEGLSARSELHAAEAAEEVKLELEESSSALYVDSRLKRLAGMLRHCKGLTFDWEEMRIYPLDVAIGDADPGRRSIHSISQGKQVVDRGFRRRLAAQTDVDPEEVLARGSGINGTPAAVVAEMEFDRRSHRSTALDHLRIGGRDGVARATHVLLGELAARPELLSSPEMQRDVEKSLMRPGVLEKLVGENPILREGRLWQIFDEAQQVATDLPTRLFVARLRFRAERRLGLDGPRDYGKFLATLLEDHWKEGLLHQHILYERMEYLVSEDGMPDIVAHFCAMHFHCIEPAYEEFAVEDRIGRWVRRQLDRHRDIDWTANLEPTLRAIYGPGASGATWEPGEGEFQYRSDSEMVVDLAAGRVYLGGATLRLIPHEVVAKCDPYRVLFGSERILAQERRAGGHRLFSFEREGICYELHDGSEPQVLAQIGGRWAQFVPNLLSGEDPGELPAACFRHRPWVDCLTGADFYFTDEKQGVCYSAQRIAGGVRRLMHHHATEGRVPLVNVAQGGLPSVLAALEAPNQVRVVNGALHLDRINLTFEPVGEGLFRTDTYPHFVLRESEQPSLFDDGQAYGVVLLHENNPDRRLFVAHAQELLSHDEGSARANRRKGEKYARFNREPLSAEGGKRIAVEMSLAGELETNVPEDNLWLAYLFMAKGRYEEAHVFLEKGLSASEPSLFYEKVCHWIASWQDDSAGALAIQLKLIGFLGEGDWTRTSFGGLSSIELVRKASRYHERLQSPACQPRVRLTERDLQRIEAVVNRGLSGLVMEAMKQCLDRLSRSGFERDPALVGEPNFEAGPDGADYSLDVATYEVCKERGFDEEKASSSDLAVLDGSCNWGREFCSIYRSVQELDPASAELDRWKRLVRIGRGGSVASASLRKLLYQAILHRQAGNDLEPLPPPPRQGRLMGLSLPFGIHSQHRDETEPMRQFLIRLDKAQGIDPAVASDRIPMKKTFARVLGARDYLMAAKGALDLTDFKGTTAQIDALHDFLADGDSIVSDPVPQLLFDSGVMLEIVTYIGEVTKGAYGNWLAARQRKEAISAAVEAAAANVKAADGIESFPSAVTIGAKIVGEVLKGFRDAYRLGIQPDAAIRSANAAARSGEARDAKEAFFSAVVAHYVERHGGESMPEAKELLRLGAKAVDPVEGERYYRAAGLALVDLVWGTLHADLSQLLRRTGIDAAFLKEAIPDYRRAKRLIEKAMSGSAGVDLKKLCSGGEEWVRRELVPLFKQARGPEQLLRDVVPEAAKKIDHIASPFMAPMSRSRAMEQLDDVAAARPTRPVPYSLKPGRLMGVDDQRFREVVMSCFQVEEGTMHRPTMGVRQWGLFERFRQSHHQRLADETSEGFEEATRRLVRPVRCTLDHRQFGRHVADQRAKLEAERKQLEGRITSTLRSVRGKQISLEAALHLWEANQLNQLHTAYGLPGLRIDSGLESDLEELELRLIALEELDQWRLDGEEIQEATDPLVRESQVRKLHQRVQREHFYVKGCDDPEARRILAVERDQKIVVRRDQIETANQKIERPNGVTQNRLGMGKSTVIAKLILAAWADGYHLATLISTEEDQGQALLREDRATRYPLDMPIYQFHFGEAKDCELAEIEQRFVDLRRTAADRGVVVTTKESLLLFRARYLEQFLERLPRALKRRDDAILPEDKERAERDLEQVHKLIDVWSACLRFMRARQKQLWDEVDRIGDPSDMTNLALNQLETLSPEMQDVGIEIIEKVIGTWNPQVELLQNRQAVTLLRRDSETGLLWIDRLREWIAGSYAKDIDRSNEEQVKAYLLNRQEGAEILPTLRARRDFEKIKAIKNFLGEAWMALANEDRVEVIRHQGRLIPCLGAGRPIIDAKIASPWEEVLGTVANYARQNVDREQIEKLVERLRDLQLRASRSGGRPPPEVDRFERGFGVRLKERVDVAVIARQVNRDWRSRLQFCRDYHLPTITYHAKQVRGESAKLAALARSAGGFSGTLSLLHALPVGMERMGARDTTIDCEGLLHMLHWGEMEGGARYVRPPSGDALLDVLLGCGKSDGLADTGALLKDYSVDEVVTRLANPEVMEQVKRGARHIVYVDPETDHWMVRDVGMTCAERYGDRHGLDLKLAFIFYDELSTRAKDFKAPFKWRLTVTVGDKSRLTKVLQGENRNRILDGGQELQFLLARHLRLTFGAEEDSKLIVNAARWLIGTEADYQAPNNVKGQLHELRGEFEKMLFFAMQEIGDPEDRHGLLELIEETFSKKTSLDGENIDELDLAVGCLERVRQQERARFDRFERRFIPSMKMELTGGAASVVSEAGRVVLEGHFREQRKALQGYQLLPAELLPSGRMPILNGDDGARLNVRQSQRAIVTDPDEDQPAAAVRQPTRTWKYTHLRDLWNALDGDSFVGLADATDGLFDEGYVSTNMGVAPDQLWNGADPYVYVLCLRGDDEWRDVAVSHKDYTQQVVPLLIGDSTDVKAYVLRLDWNGGQVVHGSPGADESEDADALRRLRVKWTLLSGGVNLVDEAHRREFAQLIGAGARAEKLYKLHQGIMRNNRPANLDRFEGSPVQEIFIQVLGS
jgi:Protein of unknown function (DUF3638)